MCMVWSRNSEWPGIWHRWWISKYFSMYQYMNLIHFLHHLKSLVYSCLLWHLWPFVCLLASFLTSYIHIHVFPALQDHFWPWYLNIYHSLSFVSLPNSQRMTYTFFHLSFHTPHLTLLIQLLDLPTPPLLSHPYRKALSRIPKSFWQNHWSVFILWGLLAIPGTTDGSIFLKGIHLKWLECHIVFELLPPVVHTLFSCAGMSSPSLPEDVPGHFPPLLSPVIPLFVLSLWEHFLSTCTKPVPSLSTKSSLVFSVHSLIFFLTCFLFLWFQFPLLYGKFLKLHFLLWLHTWTLILWFHLPTDIHFASTQT